MRASHQSSNQLPVSSGGVVVGSAPEINTMKAYELEVGDTFTQDCAPDNTWIVSGISTVKKGGAAATGEVAKMGMTSIELISGPLYEEKKEAYAGSSHNPMVNFCALNPNQNVTIVKKGASPVTPMRVGKHKGKALADVPADYLNWARNNAVTMFDRSQLRWIKENI